VERKHLHTEVIHEQVHAGSVVLAGLILTRADVALATNASPSLGAHTLESTDFVSTRRAVQARIGRAIVDISFAECSGVALATMTKEGVVKIYAAIRAELATRIAEALVDLRLAMQPGVTGSAFAYESFQLIYARGAVLTRIRCAVIDGVLAIFARVTGFAGTYVVVDMIEALAVVPARC